MDKDTTGAAGCSIRFENVSKLYRIGGEDVRALDRLDLEVGAGEFLAIMGPSGCGKSTLLHLAAGLDRPTEGAVYLDGNPISGLSDDELSLFRRRRVGFIFQFFNLLPNLTAGENAALPLMMMGTNVREWKKEAERWLKRTGLGDRLDHYPSELSGGQMQKVAIVRALIARPQVIMADEPTGNLDSRSGEEIMAIIRELSREISATVMLVTHDREVAALSDRLVVMKDGRIGGQEGAGTAAGTSGPAPSTQVTSSSESAASETACSPGDTSEVPSSPPAQDH